jgi:hypothetical protein
MTKSSNVKGHCIVWLGDYEKRTDVIISAKCENKDNRPITDPFQFEVEVKESITINKRLDTR